MTGFHFTGTAVPVLLESWFPFHRIPGSLGLEYSRVLYNKILTWADMFEGSTLEGKKMIMWQVVEKVRIYRDYKFEVDLKPTIREFKELWRKRNTSSNNGAA